MFVYQLDCINAVNPLQNCLLVFGHDSDFRISEQNDFLVHDATGKLLFNSFFLLATGQKYKTNKQKTKPTQTEKKKETN